MSAVVKFLPNNWIEPDSAVRGEIVSGDNSGYTLMRCPNGFYWLEAETEQGHFVTARKDLCLTEEGFSQTLSETIALYRRYNAGSDEFVSYCDLNDGARRLLTAGHKDSLERIEKSFERQVGAVAAVGTASLLFASLGGGITPLIAYGYFLAAASAWLLKKKQTIGELRHADKELRARLADSHQT